MKSGGIGSNKTSYKTVAVRSLWVAVWLLLVVGLARQQGQIVPAVIVILLVGVPLVVMMASTAASDFIIGHRWLCLAAGIALALSSSVALIAVAYKAEPSPMTAAAMAALIILSVMVALLPHLVDTYRRAKARQRPAPPNVAFAGIQECLSAFQFVIGAWRPFLRLCAPWIFGCWIIPWASYHAMEQHWIWLKQLEQEGKPIGPPFAPPAGLVLSAVAIICVVVAISCFAVAWHRYVAGDECAFSFRASLPSRRSFRYLWRLTVGFWMFGFVAGLADTDIPGVEAIGSPLIESAVGVIVYIAVLFLALWGGSLWLLAFPAAALGDRRLKATDLVPLAKSLGRGLRSGATLAILPCHFVYLATLLAIFWLFKEGSVAAAQIVSLFALVVLFSMIAFVATFLSRAYAVVMSSPAGLELAARN